MAGLVALAASCFSVSSPALNAIVSEICGAEERRKAYSLIYLGQNLGYAAGPAVGGLLFYRHLNILFFLDFLTACAAAAVILFFVKSPATGPARPRTEEHSRAAEAFGLRFLVETPVLLWFSAILLLYNFSYSQWVFMLPLQSADLFRENGARFYSVLVSANALTVIIATPFLTKITHKKSTLSAIRTGGVFYALSFILFAADKLWGLLLAGIIALTIGEILTSVNANVFVAARTPKEYFGRANSLISIVNGAGVAVGPVVMGHVLTLLGFEEAWLLVALLALAASFAMLALQKKYTA